MDYKVLYRKYRPTNFNELVDQDNIKEILINSIKYDKIAHAYIFTGPRGTGKTSTAKIFAKTLNCLENKDGISCDKCEMCENYNSSADIIEIDAASNNGVEEIRTLCENVMVAPYNSKYKVYIIDEVHMLSNSAWNAFLKTLEEPPKHVIFILATTELNKVPETVKSRCQIYNFKKISNEKLIGQLSNICKKENIKITNEALKQISKLSNGCLRDALSYLDKVSKFNTEITEDILEANFGIINSLTLYNLYNYIKNGNSKEIDKIINDISYSGITPVNFINDFLSYLMDLIVEGKKDRNELLFIKDLINKLNELTTSFNSFTNSFILIKSELITMNYFPGNNFNEVKPDDKMEPKQEEHQEKPQEEETDIEEVDNNTDALKKVRINNSYAGASKELKKEFKISWDKYISNLTVLAEYNLLGYIDKSTIEVVSPTNVLFSFKNETEAIVFNKHLSSIEKNYNDNNKTNYKFYALSLKEWKEEKETYINNKDKNYSYIDENMVIKKEEVKIQTMAEELFGDSIIEIN